MKKDLGIHLRKILVFVLCFLMVMAFCSCQKENDSSEVARLLNWFTDGHFSSYTFQTIEVCEDEQGHTYVYIVADYDDAEGQGTTSGVIWNGFMNGQFVHTDDFSGPKKSIADTYLNLKSEGKVKVYSAEEIEAVVARGMELAKEAST